MANRGKTTVEGVSGLGLSLWRAKRASLHEDAALPVGTVVIVLQAEREDELEAIDIRRGESVAVVQCPSMSSSVSSFGGSVFRNIVFSNIIVGGNVASLPPPTLEVDVFVSPGLDVALTLSSLVSMEVGDLGGTLEAEVSSQASLVLGMLKGSHTEIEASSGGQVRVAGIVSGKVSFEASSSPSTISVTGSIECDKASFEASSSARILVSSLLRCSKATMEVSSDGRVVVEGGTIGKLQAEASSAGRVTFQGTADEAVAEASSAGHVRIGQVKGRLSKEQSSGGRVECPA